MLVIRNVSCSCALLETCQKRPCVNNETASNLEIMPNGMLLIEIHMKLKVVSNGYKVILC